MIFFFLEGFDDRGGTYFEETEEMTFDDEDDVDRPNAKDMSHVSVITVGDEPSPKVQNSRRMGDKRHSNLNNIPGKRLRIR